LQVLVSRTRAHLGADIIVSTGPTTGIPVRAKPAGAPASGRANQDRSAVSSRWLTSRCIWFISAIRSGASASDAVVARRRERVPRRRHDRLVLTTIPLNDSLDTVNVNAADVAAKWSAYVDSWTPWNHVRSLSGLVAAGLLTIGLTRR
jgi:hypothetical protein